jgi:transcriptional regulator with XRE-family HTH domain
MASKDKEAGFGDKLKALRKAKGLSLEELGSLVGLKPAYLAGLEADENLPHVAEIITLARTLSVEPSAFMEGGAERKSGRRAKAAATRTRDYAYETLTPYEPHMHLMGFRVTIDPESKHRKVVYTHEGEEYIYVLEGRIELKVGGKSYSLGPGESLRFDSGQHHQIRNPDKCPAVFVDVIFTP